VQLVAMVDALVRVEVEPALATLRRAGRLSQATDTACSRPPGQLDEILLQRRDAEGVLDLEIAEGSVRPVRVDPERAVAAEEAGRYARVRERGVVEVAEDGCRARVLHGCRVLRAAPLVELGRVAVGAAIAADETRGDDGGVFHHWTASAAPL
jgi:hypothetical protein